LPTLLAHFPLEISFYADLGTPKRQQRTISPENAKTYWPVKFKNGGDAVFIKKNPLYWSIFLKMTRELDSLRSHSANIAN
jgi:hypothetical protein